MMREFTANNFRDMTINILPSRQSQTLRFNQRLCNCFSFQLFCGVDCVRRACVRIIASIQSHRHRCHCLAVSVRLTIIKPGCTDGKRNVRNELNWKYTNMRLQWMRMRMVRSSDYWLLAVACAWASNRIVIRDATTEPYTTHFSEHTDSTSVSLFDLRMCTARNQQKHTILHSHPVCARQSAGLDKIRNREMQTLSSRNFMFDFTLAVSSDRSLLLICCILDSCTFVRFGELRKCKTWAMRRA